MGQLPYYNLAQGHSYQRKKTALLLLSAVLETCTDTWSPDKKKGQPPGAFAGPLPWSTIIITKCIFLQYTLITSVFYAVNMGCLINYVKQRGQWDFFCLSKQLVLISCLEDSTNEVVQLYKDIYYSLSLFNCKLKLLFFFTDSGTFSKFVIEIFPAQFSKQCFCCSADTNQTASLQPSSAWGSNGSADDKGASTKVSNARSHTQPVSMDTYIHRWSWC